MDLSFLCGYGDDLLYRVVLVRFQLRPVTEFDGARKDGRNCSSAVKSPTLWGLLTEAKLGFHSGEVCCKVWEEAPSPLSKIGPGTLSMKIF